MHNTVTFVVCTQVHVWLMDTIAAVKMAVVWVALQSVSVMLIVTCLRIVVRMFHRTVNSKVAMYITFI